MFFALFLIRNFSGGGDFDETSPPCVERLHDQLLLTSECNPYKLDKTKGFDLPDRCLVAEFDTHCSQPTFPSPNHLHVVHIYGQDQLRFAMDVEFQVGTCSPKCGSKNVLCSSVSLQSCQKMTRLVSFRRNRLCFNRSPCLRSSTGCLSYPYV